MWHDQNLSKLWEILFQTSIGQTTKDYLYQNDISTIEEFSANYNKENFLKQRERDRFDLLQVMMFLNLSEENLICLIDVMIQQGIDTVDLLQIAKEQDLKRLGLSSKQSAMLRQQIKRFFDGNIQFDQKLKSIVMNKDYFEDIRQKLFNLHITSVQDLFSIPIEQAEQLGINKFKLKTQKDQFYLQQKIKNQSQQLNQKQNINQFQPLIIKPKQQNRQRELNDIMHKSTLIGKENGFNLYQYPLYDRNQLQNVESYKTMLVIGQTGSGKTTFLNFFLNYYLGVNFDDDFRFILVQNNGSSQAVSQTNQVRIYYLSPFNQKLGIRLVDTPGFGDTSGISQDQTVEKQIKQAFTNEIESLSAVCFLVQASNARLTPNQNYILSSILQLFGKDLVKNFIVIFSFCDSGEPTAIEAIRYKGDVKNPKSVMSELVDQISPPWYLKLNSSAFMLNDSSVALHFWNMAVWTFDQLYKKKLIGNESISLFLTQQVIKERDQLIVIIQNLRPKIDMLLNMIENIKNIHQQISGLDARIIGSSNFKIMSNKYIISKIDLEPGEYTTNCVICNYTCHYPCKLPDDQQKIGCAAMQDGYCKQCSKKCKWDNHKNMPFYYKDEQIQIETELDELKKQYTESQSKKSEKEQILKGIEDEYVKLQVNCMEQQSDLMNSINKLKKIALQPSCCKHHEEYVEIMIQEEMNNKREGYLQRINQLNEIKANWKFVREASNNQGGIEITRKFIETNIPKTNILSNLSKKKKPRRY